MHIEHDDDDPPPQDGFSFWDYANRFAELSMRWARLWGFL
jgi:hypothetical protein